MKSCLENNNNNNNNSNNKNKNNTNNNDDNNNNNNNNIPQMVPNLVMLGIVMATQQFYVIVDLTGGVGGTLLYFIFPGTGVVLVLEWCLYSSSAGTGLVLVLE